MPVPYSFLALCYYVNHIAKRGSGPAVQGAYLYTQALYALPPDEVTEQVLTELRRKIGPLREKTKQALK